MTLIDLRNALQRLAGAGEPLPIGATVIGEQGKLPPRAGLDELLRSRLLLSADLEVKATGELPQPTATELSFPATVDGVVLGAGGAGAQISFVLANDGQVDVVVGVKPDAGWTLGAAFPILGGEPFRSVTLGSAAYVVSSAQAGSYRWNGSLRKSPRGAQLYCLITLSGPLALVLDLLEGASGSTSFELIGPIAPAAPHDTAGPVPELSLSAPLGHNISIPGLELVEPRIQIESLLGEGGERLVWLVFTSTLTVDGTPLFELKASLAGGGSALTFGLSALPPPQPQITPAQIAKLIGGPYSQYIPKELEQQFEEVELRGLSTTINLSPVSVRSVSAAIGTSHAWGPWGPAKAKLDQLTLSVIAVNPFGGHRQIIFGFDAEAEILHEVFDGKFQVDMTYNLTSKAVAVAAGFEGTLNLNELISGISAGTVVVPEDWVKLSLSDFGVVFENPGAGESSYLLYGKAGASATLPFLGVHLSAELQASVESATTKTYRLLGALLLGGAAFTGSATISGADTRLLAGWHAVTESDRLGIAAIVEDLGLTPPSIPAGLDLELTEATMTYQAAHRLLVLEIVSASYGTGVFASVSSNTAPHPRYFAGIKVDRTIDLVSLPLLGSVLGDSGQLAVNGIQVLASSPIGEADAGLLSSAIAEIDPGAPAPPQAGMEGLALTLTLQAGDSAFPLSLSLGGGGGGGEQALRAGQAVRAGLPALGRDAVARSVELATAPAPPPPSDGTTWYALQKTFGPVSFQKVGIRYQDSKLWFLMDASLAAGGLTISVYGLGAGSPLSDFSVKFTIEGLGVTMKQGPIELSGALLGTLEPVNFYGELLVGIGDVRLGALAGYAMVEDHPSLFGYVVVDTPIGGPPYFFVTGLAGGVGFNRQLTIPPVAGVAEFPLVQWATGRGEPPSSASGEEVKERVTAVIERLSQVVTPAVGEYWLAAGIHFTTFELLDCFALLTVKFGTELEVALLGLATVAIPPAPSTPVAQAQLALEASFAPSTGLIAIGGQLTPASYVFSRDCHLTGGFAFWTWVSGEHEGEVVVTLGGYSPRFTAPNYYPQVPRLGLSWQIGSLSIVGGLYFAMTSSAVMAGGGLNATWEDGDIEAWFSVQADFLIVYEPFHYYISAGIQLGASFTLDLLLTSITVTIHVGVEIEIWGPEFAGNATVDLSIVSFTIHFGSSEPQTDTKIGWSEFVERLLPQAQAGQSAGTLAANAPASAEPVPAIVQIIVTGGILKQLDGSGPIDFIADAERLTLVTRSAIPAKEFTASANVSLPGEAPAVQSFGIGPTGTEPEAFRPKHEVTIETSTDRAFIGAYDTHNVAKALWEKREFDEHGVPQGVDPLKGTTIEGVATGLQLAPVVTPPDHTREIPLEQLQYTIDEHIQGFAWTTAAGPESDPFDPEATVWETIEAPLAKGNRGLLLAAMRSSGLEVPETLYLEELSSPAAFDLLEPPTLRLLGEQR